MNIDIKVVVAIFVSMVCCAYSLHAQDGYLYGILNGGSSHTFGRINIETGASETLSGDLGKILSFHAGTGTIDSRRGHFVLGTERRGFIRMDLKTGKVVDIDKHRALSLTGLHYDAPTDRFYAIDYHYINDLLIFDGEDLSLERLTTVRQMQFKKFENGIDYRYRGSNTFLDSRRGWYMFVDLNSTLWIYDIYTHIYTPRLIPELADLHMTLNPADGLLYGLSPGTVKGEVKIATCDPSTGQFTYRPLEGLVGWPGFSPSYRVAIHAATSTFYANNADNDILRVNLVDATWSVITTPPYPHTKEMEIFNGYGQAGILLNGKTFADADGNCEPGAPEPSLSNRQIEFESIGNTPGEQFNYRAVTDRDGNYYLRVPAGEYLAQPIAEYPWELNCEDDSRLIKVNENGVVEGRLDFAFEAVETYAHHELSISSGPAQAGYDIRYYIRCINKGTQPLNGKLVLHYDPVLLNFRSTIPTTTQSSGYVEWTVTKLPIGSETLIVVTLRIPPDESLRDKTICARVEVPNDKDDLSTQFRKDETCIVIRASYDPNDISVTPRGFGDRGAILVEDSTLAYTIRFQNIGDAPARDVVILDTLDPNLNINSLYFGASSHVYSVSIVRDRILEFRFEGIELPGKEQDESGSQGVVKYKVGFDPSLIPGTVIRNRAAIYFDFNKPVITNTVLNTITETLTDVPDLLDEPELELRSPSPGIFVWHGAPGPNSKIAVYTMLGRKIQEQSFGAASFGTIDLRSQASGQYLIRLSEGLRSSVRVVSVVH